MKTSLCPNHLRAVTNYFDSGVAFQFEVDAAHCVVCHGEMRVEDARRYAAHVAFNAKDQRLKSEQPLAYND